MAIATLTPAAHDATPIEDPVSYEEAALSFMETGHPAFQCSVKAAARKLARWAAEDGHPTQPIGRVHYVSYSDLLESYTRRFPAPRRP
ncbi:hypothetical protein HUT11_35390 (plasmid) [Streptomyces seoulensis]|nr:hypothetical protein HUT11_35390 [Streptomyces seoulensis]